MKTTGSEKCTRKYPYSLFLILFSYFVKMLDSGKSADILAEQPTEFDLLLR
jgi:hypothetical protein